LFAAAELAAGGVDVAASAFSYVNVHAAFTQNLLEFQDIVRLGAAVGESGNFVVADEIHVGANGFADSD